MDDELFYEQVNRELADGMLRDGLWTKALVKCDGDKDSAHRTYIELRKNQLIEEAKRAAQAAVHSKGNVELTCPFCGHFGDLKRIRRGGFTIVAEYQGVCTACARVVIERFR